MGSNFRSVTGCVICGTKSSSSRFTDSNRFSQHFVSCFGSGAKGRCGHLCNACVLCVKRYLDRPNVRRKAAAFEKVLDSKVGAGPKHMKQIAKQQRRKEARLVAAANNAAGASSSSAVSASAKGVSSFASSKDEHSSTSGGSCSNSVVSFPSTTMSDYRSDCASTTGSTNSREVHTSKANNLSASSSCLLPTHAADSSESRTRLSNHTEPEFRAPHPSQRAPGRNRYRRNFTLQPVKMPATYEEINSLLREILDKNSQAINLDAMQIHTAVQYQLRLRNRTVSTRFCEPHTASPHVTGQRADQRADQHSVSSGSFGSSVGNLDSLRG